MYSMIYYTNNLLLLFFSSIWCYWPPWAFLLFLTGNIFQYSRINSIGGNFFSLYIYIKKGNSFLCSSDCLLSDHRSRQKVVRRCHFCPRLVMCLLSASTTFDVNRGPLMNRYQHTGSINLNLLTTSKDILDILRKNILMTLGNICSWDWEG